MPIIFFNTTKTTLFSSTEKNARSMQGLEFDVTISPKTNIQLASDEKLTDIEFHFIVVPPQENSKDSIEKYSYIIYHKGSHDGFGVTAPSCFIRVYVPKELFSSLLSASLNGETPSNITIELDDMGQDNSAGKWDNVKNHKLPIVSFNTQIPLTNKAS